jgi:hypothetical protein
MKSKSKPKIRRTSNRPTLEQFAKYQHAWDWFNEKLFEGSLSPCLLNFSRHRGALGFFTAKRWSNGELAIHEISLNPDSLGKPLDEVMSTLAHEMVHQWQQDFGSPSRSGYHDREWAEKMVEIGLIPSDTGEPGGKPTGQRMSHYIDTEGPFLAAFRDMPQDFVLPWISHVPVNAKLTGSSPSKRYQLKCPGCQQQVWGKTPSLNVLCGDCHETYLPASLLKGEAVC